MKQVSRRLILLLIGSCHLWASLGAQSFDSDKLYSDTLLEWLRPNLQYFVLDSVADEDTHATLQQASIVQAQLEAQFKATPTIALGIALSKYYQDQAEWFKKSPQFNLSTVFFYYKKAIDLLETMRPLPNERLAEIYCDLSAFSVQASEYDASKYQANKAAFYFQRSDKRGENVKMLAFDILNRQAMGFVYSEPKQALKLIEPAWQLLQDDKSTKIQAKLLMSKGVFYGAYIGAFDEDTPISSLPFLKKSAQLYESFSPLEHGNSLFKIYEDLMWYYGALEEIDSCDFYFDKMEQLLPILKNPILSNRFHSLKGNAFIRRKDYVEAKVEIAKSLALCDRYCLKHTSIYRFNHNLMGAIAMEQGQYDVAIGFFRIANDLAIRYKHGDKKAFFEHLTQLYEKKGDYEKALFYYKVYADSTAAEKERASFEQLGKSELKLNILSQEKKLAQKHNQQTIFIAALIISALAMSFLYRNYYLKQKNNVQLEKLNADLARQNNLLDKRNSENELLLKEIHHRVKNNLETVSSLLELQSAQVEDDEIQNVMRASQSRVQSMGILHQKLYQGDNLAHIEMKDYFKNLTESVLETYDAWDKVEVECDMAPIELDIDTAVPIGLIVNELLTNAIKYAFPDDESGKVYLSLTQNNTKALQLIVADDGVGYSPSTTPKGTGFGSQLVALLNRQLNGSMHHDVIDGTRLTFVFPVLVGKTPN